MHWVGDGMHLEYLCRNIQGREGLSGRFEGNNNSKLDQKKISSIR